MHTKVNMIKIKRIVVKPLLPLLLFFLTSTTAWAQGANMSNPIVAGTYSGGSHTYTDTRSNSGYGNDYGQASEDIFYKFTIQATTQIDISHCSSGFDTYVHLLDGNGNLLAVNDDNGPLCSGLTASIRTTLAAGTYYVVSEGYGSNSGSITTTFNLVVEEPFYDTRNFVRTWEATAPQQDGNTLIGMGLKDVKQATTYFDGLGRPEQAVIKQGSLITGGTAVDMVNPLTYDDFGREIKKYLPYAAPTSDGLFKTGAFTDQLNFYNGSTSPINGQGETIFYSKTDYEVSPLNRVLKSMAPGNSWAGAGRGVEQKYLVNTTNDEVRIWEVTNGANIGDFGSYATSSLYPTGEIYKSITVDEGGKQVVEFKDKEGKVILKKVQLSGAPAENHTGWLCTYYIYDDLGELRAVVQPKGVELLIANNWDMNALNGDILKEQCFRYEYDERGRMFIKKVPGAAEVYMIYDARDRLVMTQDGNQRTAQPYPKWLFTLYDDLNRPVKTGIIQTLGSRADHQANANNSIAYPDINNYINEVLSETFYDNYEWLPGQGNPFVATRYTGNDYMLLTPDNSTYPYPQPLTQSNALKGMVTGSKTKVLGSSQYMYSINYYDEKGRIIQTRAHNITGCADIFTFQYSFAGQLLIKHEELNKCGSPNQHSYVTTKFDYDHLGRVEKVNKHVSNNLGNTTGWKVIAQNSYDAIGQLKSKKLSPNHNSGQGLETLTYDYNIRGWMLGANRDFAKKADNSLNNYFGFDLAYDKLDIKAASGSSIGAYSGQGLFNGNIKGMVWKSTGDDEIRRYEYSYDGANRLLSGDFKQYTNSSFNLDAGINYSMRMGSGVDPTSAYDADGNIKGMYHMGWKVGGSVPVDDLIYGYEGGSNKLKYVFDHVYSVNSKMGDFKESSPNYTANTGSGTADYSYDTNGNLISDSNKDISSITYNHLNLPQVITTPKGTITYTYDAAGAKLKKVVAETGKAEKTTLYLGGAVYEDNVLQFVGHEEGRIRWKSDNSTFQWDYFLKDHLGNTRMVLTEEVQTAAYLAATMETASAATEEALYSKLPETRADKPSGYPYDPYLDPNAKVAKVRGDGQKIGPGIVLKVMAGDKVNIRASSWYKTNGASPNAPNSVLQDLINMLNSGVGTAPGSKATTQELQDNNVFSGSAQQFLNSQGSNGPSIPKAYLNWVLFDEQFKYVSSSSGFEQVGGNEVLTTHQRNGLPLSKNGYLYVYVSNETPNIDVFFDNVQVTHIKGPVLEETHYYPYGLTMHGISSKAAGIVENKKKYNGIELENDLEIQTYDAFFRELDPQIARWWQIDPVTDGYESISPYASMYDNPITYSDPLGNEGEACCGGFFTGIVEGVKDGFNDTKSFVKSLGTAEGWKNLATGMANINPMGVTTPEKLEFQAKTVDNTMTFVKNVPSMSAKEVGHAIGYGLEKAAEAAVLSKGAGMAKNSVNAVRATEAKGLITPRKFFGNLTESQAKSTLKSKYGNPTYSTSKKTTFFNPKTKRSFTVHNEQGHGAPHVDVNTRGWPNTKTPNGPLNHQKFPLTQNP